MASLQEEDASPAQEDSSEAPAELLSPEPAAEAAEEPQEVSAVDEQAAASPSPCDSGGLEPSPGEDEEKSSSNAEHPEEDLSEFGPGECDIVLASLQQSPDQQEKSEGEEDGNAQGGNPRFLSHCNPMFGSPSKSPGSLLGKEASFEAEEKMEIFEEPLQLQEEPQIQQLGPRVEAFGQSPAKETRPAAVPLRAARRESRGLCNDSDAWERGECIRSLAVHVKYRVKQPGASFSWAILQSCGNIFPTCQL